MPLPSVYKIIATVMLQYGFEHGFGLAMNFQRIIEPIKVLVKGARYRLGYVPTNYEVKMKKSSDQALSRPIPHLYQSFLVREYVDHDGLREGICDLFEEINVVIEDEVELDGIRDVDPGEQLQNLTSAPILIPRSSWYKDIVCACFENRW